MSLRKSEDYKNFICYSKYPYFNLTSQKLEYKKRPVLLIGFEKETLPCDVTVLPVASIKNKVHKHDEYDIEIGLNVCPNLKVITMQECYVRTHKPSTVSSRDITISDFDDLKLLYSDKINEIKKAHDKFNTTLF